VRWLEQWYAYMLHHGFSVCTYCPVLPLALADQLLLPRLWSAAGHGSWLTLGLPRGGWLPPAPFVFLHHAIDSYGILEIRSVERGICPITTSTINERTIPIIMAGYMAHEREGRISTSGLKSDVTIVFLDPDFL